MDVGSRNGEESTRVELTAGVRVQAVVEALAGVLGFRELATSSFGMGSRVRFGWRLESDSSSLKMSTPAVGGASAPPGSR